jgi:Family of unknown function (DUF6011)
MASSANTQDTPRVHRCLRPGCGRVLRSAESIALGLGPRCAAKIRKAAGTADLSQWTASQVEDARQAIEDGAVVPSSREGVFHVVSSDGSEVHRTAERGCNCTSGLKTRQPRPCWHRAAVAIVLASQAPAAVTPAAPAIPLPPAPLPASADIWAELDAAGATAGALAPF